MLPVRRFRAALLALALPWAVHAQATRQGFSTDRLARIDRFMQQQVDSNRIGGAVALIMRDGKVVYEKAFGWSDRDAGRRMTPDAIFRIASQSKAITSTAALMLVEEGKISLMDPVSRWIPAFAHTAVISRADTGRTTVPAKRQITIKDLLTHTAGISYGTDAIVAARYREKGLGPAAGYGWYTADKDEPICTTMERLATLPFVSQPGEMWVYGYNTDVLGCVVERASGMPLDQFVATRITGPLGMHDTYYFVPPAKRDRLVAVTLSDSTGHATRAGPGGRGQGDYVDGPRKSFAGGAGMLSTAHDYARFLRMIAGRGQLDGVRILSPKTVDLMTTDQTNGLYAPPGLGFGLAFQVVQKTGADGLVSAGTYGWNGAYNTSYKVDPGEGLIMVFMLNHVPYNAEAFVKWPTLVYQALEDSRLVAGQLVRPK